MATTWRKWLIVVAAAGLMGALAYQGRSRKPQKALVSPSNRADTSLNSQPVTLANALPHQQKRDGFVSSGECRRCHENQYDSWHDTYHRTMTQVASPETVVAPFDNVQISSRGRDYFLTREGDKFFVTMADADWEAGAEGNGLDLDKVNPPVVKREVIMTTGSHHMQSYWIPSNVSNMLRQIPLTYLIADKRWVPREDIFIAPPDQPRHFAVWNDNCLVCHAVDGNPGFDLRAMKVATQTAELGISCEACHGPGQKHIDFHDKKLLTIDKDPILNPVKCSTKISSEICGQCHSYFVPHDMKAFAVSGYKYRAGDDLSTTHRLISYKQALAENHESAIGSYWSDGTGRLAGREFSAMMESPCYIQGALSCTSCHSLHGSDPNDQLAKNMDGNQACIQCHSKIAGDLTAHTHHAPESDGSLCYNCHMPHTSFGVMKAMRSHRVQSPKVVSKADSDQPNACNLCHMDQTLKWTADKLEEWYQQPQIEFTQEEQDVAAGVLWLTKGDAVQRAVAAWHSAWQPARKASGNDWQTPFLAELLVDDYAVVRYLAGKALTSHEMLEEAKFDYVAPMLERTSVRDQVLVQWASAKRPQAQNSEATIRLRQLLFDPSSGLSLRDKILQLIRLQDKRPIYLPE